jgi:hypothetical protein
MSAGLLLAALGVGLAILGWLPARRGSRAMALTLWCAYGPYSDAEQAEKFFRRATRVALGSDESEHSRWTEGWVTTFRQWGEANRLGLVQRVVWFRVCGRAHGRAFAEASREFQKLLYDGARTAVRGINETLELAGQTLEAVDAPDGTLNFELKQIWSDERMELENENLRRTLVGAFGADLNWSDKPGALESNLLHRLLNPLFPLEKQIVRGDELKEAQEQDERQAQEFLRRNIELANSVLELPAHVSWAEWNGIRHDLDQLIDDIVCYGGTAASYLDSLLKLRASLIQTGRDALCDQPEALAQLEKAEAFRSECVVPRQHPIIGRIRVMEPEDFVPALLSEAPEMIRFVMTSLNNSDVVRDFTASAVQLLRELESKGTNTTDLRRKIGEAGLLSPAGKHTLP